MAMLVATKYIATMHHPKLSQCFNLSHEIHCLILLHVMHVCYMFVNSLICVHTIYSTNNPFT